ncbi:DUF6230 family protein [Streptomyces sp. NPDC002446]
MSFRPRFRAPNHALTALAARVRESRRHRPRTRETAGTRTEGEGGDGRTSPLRFMLAALPLFTVGGLLLAAGAAGAVPMAFSGEVPLSVHAERVEGDGVSAGLGLSPEHLLQPSLVTRVAHATVWNACASSTATLPAIGPVSVVIRIDKARATDLNVHAGPSSARTVAVDQVGLSVPDLAAGLVTGRFTVRAGRLKATDVHTLPRSFVSGGITTSGVHIDLARGRDGCAGGSTR